MRKYIEICLTSSMQAALERYMLEKKVSVLDGGLFLMDDLQISISLTELMTLIESAKRGPEAAQALVSLSRRLDGLYSIYTQVLEHLTSMQQKLDNL